MITNTAAPAHTLGTPAEPDGAPTASNSTSGAAIVGHLLELDAAGAWVAAAGGAGVRILRAARRGVVRDRTSDGRRASPRRLRGARSAEPISPASAVGGRR
jgi:hypothetical protein